MAERDYHDANPSPRRPPEPGRQRRPRNEFERFCAEKALTGREKAALPRGLRRLFGWE